MRSKTILAATAIFVWFAVFLCACGRDAGDATTEPTFNSPWSEAQVFTLPTEPQTEKADGTEKDETEKRQPDDDAILRRIETARAVYKMFSASRPQLDKADSVEVDEGLTAYRVRDPQCATMDKLRAYVSQYLSDDITERLLNIGIYSDQGGKLYALDVGIPSAATGKAVVEVTEKTDTLERYLLTVKVDTDADGVPDTEKTYESVYEKQSDGKWVFTHFESN